MGLDMVELVMRCEEFFHIEIADEKAERIQTVGDLYYTVVEELHLERPVAIPLNGEPNPLMVERHPWTQENVWPTIVAIVVDQLQVDEDEVKPHASFSNDLGCD